MMFGAEHDTERRADSKLPSAALLWLDSNQRSDPLSKLRCVYRALEACNATGLTLPTFTCHIIAEK